MAVLAVALSQISVRGETVRFQNARFEGVGSLSSGTLASAVVTGNETSSATYQYSVTGLTLDGNGTANDSLVVNLLVTAGQGGRTVYGSTNVGFGVRGSGSSRDAIEVGENLTFTISSIVPTLSGGGSFTVSHDFTEFDASGWNGGARKFRWSANGGALSQEISGPDQIISLGGTGASAETSFYVESTASSGFVTGVSFDVSVTPPPIAGVIPAGGNGGWVGSINVPGSGEISATDSLAGVPLVAGTKSLLATSLVGLGQAELGDVTFWVRLGFDNNTTSEGGRFSFNDTSDDIFTEYESEVPVPEGAQMLTSVSTVIRQNGSAAAQLAYVDDVRVLFGSGFGAWKTIFGIDPTATDTSDDDGDGIPLLVEYGLGLSPSKPSVISEFITQTLSPPGAPSGGTLNLRYRPMRGDVSYMVEASETLGAWRTSDVNQGVAASDGTVTATTPKSGSSKFLRLKIQRP